jgi:hypothetical protein
VTQRFSSTSFTVVTGHEDPSSGEGTVDWDAVANTGGTLVILMGVGRWPQIADRLMAAGRSPDTPAAAVRWGTRPEQRTTRATIATLADHPIESPSVIVVGSVAVEDLNWYEGRPLFGRTVVVTGTGDESALCADLVERAGLPRVHDLSDRLDLSQLAALVAAARLVVCGDTGVAHLASAYGTPSVLLFGPTPPALWGPPTTGPHTVLWSGAAGDAQAETLDPALAALDVDRVLAAVEERLRSTR